MMREPRHHIAWTPEMLDRAVSLRGSGKSLREIGEAFHCSRGAVKQKLQKEGVLASPKPTGGSATFRLWSGLDVERLTRMLQDGATLAKVAAALKRTEGAVNNKGRQLGLIGERRPTGGNGAVEMVHRRQETSRALRAVQGAYLAGRPCNDDQAPASDPTPAATTYGPYLSTLLEMHQRGLADLKAHRGAFADAERDVVVSEGARLRSAIAAVRAQLGRAASG